MGEIETKIPTEVLVSDRREYELAQEGFIALTMRKGSDNAAFFSASSVQKPKSFGISAEGKVAELNYRLGTQLVSTCSTGCLLTCSSRYMAWRCASTCVVAALSD